MNYVLYCCFGNKRYSKELMYSIKTFIASHKGMLHQFTIVIYTDEKNYRIISKGIELNSIKVVFEIIDHSKISEWTRVNNKIYMPRVKIKCIENFLRKYKSSLLFFDTDLIIIRSVKDIYLELNNGYSTFLYSKCLSIIKFYENYKLSKSFNSSLDSMLHYRLCKKILSEKNFVPNSLNITLQGNFNQYNSGVIGVPVTAVDIMSDILVLSDYLFENYSFYWAEEFAFSYYLKKNYCVFPCDYNCYHYSSDKWCRLLVAKSLDFFYESDFSEFQQLLSSWNIEWIHSCEVKLEDIPFLVSKINKLRNVEKLPYYVDTL